MANGKIADKISEVTEEEWSKVCPFNRQIVEEFLEESVTLSKETLKQYKSSLRIYCRWITENLDNKKMVDIKSREYLRYQNYLTRRGLSSSAIRLKRSAISSLNEYILLYYEDDHPMFKNYITKKIAQPERAFVHPKEPLTPEEFDMLIKKLEELEEWQKIAYLKFSYNTGCRRAEAVQLLKEVVNYNLIVKSKTVKNPTTNEEEAKEIKYYMTHEIRCKGKGLTGKIRKLKFDEDTMEAIKKWLEVRGEDDCPYVFISKHKGEIKQIDKTTFNRWCNTLFTSIVGRRVHPHLTRESRATNLVVYQGKDIKSAQMLLGHESSNTTEIYVIRDEEQEADDAFI